MPPAGARRRSAAEGQEVCPERLLPALAVDTPALRHAQVAVARDLALVGVGNLDFHDEVRAVLFEEGVRCSSRSRPRPRDEHGRARRHGRSSPAPCRRPGGSPFPRRRALLSSMEARSNSLAAPSTMSSNPVRPSWRCERAMRTTTPRTGSRHTRRNRLVRSKPAKAATVAASARSGRWSSRAAPRNSCSRSASGISGARAFDRDALGGDCGGGRLAIR